LPEKNRLVVGVDIHKESIQSTKKLYPDINFVVADAHHLPFQSRFFSTITLLELLEHVLAPKNVLKEAYRCLKAGGFILINVPNAYSIWYKMFRILYENFMKFRLMHLHGFKSKTSIRDGRKDELNTCF